MASPNIDTLTDTTIYDLVWSCIPEGYVEQQVPGERDSDGYFLIELDPTPSSTTTPQTSSSISTPMIANLILWDWEAKFTCEYNHTTRSYNNFNLVPGLMSEAFAIAFFSDISNYGKQPVVEELKPAWWTVTMDVTLTPQGEHSNIELFFKKRVDWIEAQATDDDLRELELGPFAQIGDNEDESDIQGDEDEDEGGEPCC